MISTRYEQHVHNDPEFPIICHRDILSSEQNFLMHWHENIELLYFRKGRAVVYCDTLPIDVNEGEVVIVNPGALHSIKATSPTCIYDCLIADKTFLDAFGLPSNEIRLSSPVNDEETRSHFDRIMKELRKKSPYYKIAVKGEVITLMTRLFRIAAPQPVQSKESGRRLDMVRSALFFIRQHYKEELSVEDICRHVGFSKFYFCRIFKEVTGKTVVDTINFMRCSNARGLLSKGICNVSESAERSGFHNLSYFSKTYKRHIGELPSETERESEKATWLQI